MILELGKSLGGSNHAELLNQHTLYIPKKPMWGSTVTAY